MPKPPVLLTEQSSLEELRSFIAQLATALDPKSRYVTELLATLDSSRDTAELIARLTASSRGARHAGQEIFERMTLEQKLRSNLITNETVLFRFSEGEWETLQGFVTRFRPTRPVRILCAPCSHGEEAFSVAAGCLQAQVSFSIDAYDIQSACIEAARSGRLSLGFPDAYLESPAVVSAQVLERIRFEVVDLLAEPGTAAALGPGPWDLIVCRNFLGYFIEPTALHLAQRLARSLEPGGALFLDSFCVGKFSGLAKALEDCHLHRRGASPIFVKGHVEV